MVLKLLTFHLLDFFFPWANDKWMSWLITRVTSKGATNDSITLSHSLSPSSLLGRYNNITSLTTTSCCFPSTHHLNLLGFQKHFSSRKVHFVQYWHSFFAWFATCSWRFLHLLLIFSNYLVHARYDLITVWIYWIFFTYYWCCKMLDEGMFFNVSHDDTKVR